MLIEIPYWRLQSTLKEVVGQSGLGTVSGLYDASRRVIATALRHFVSFLLRRNGGPKWTRTTDLTIISRVL